MEALRHGIIERSSGDRAIGRSGDRKANSQLVLMARSPDDPMSPPGILAATGRGLLDHAGVCYKPLYAKRDTPAFEPPQEAGRGLPKRNQRAGAFAAEVLR